MKINENTPYGPILETPSLSELKRYVESTGSHFFDRDTMSWFGTRGLAVYGGTVVVGTDHKAPEGYPRHWARVFRQDGSAEKVATSEDRATIVKDARRIAAELKAGTFTHTPGGVS